MIRSRATNRLLLRPRNVPGLAEADPIDTTAGILVVTGRNNVGKTRLLTSLYHAASGVIPWSTASGCELEIRVGNTFLRCWVSEDPAMQYQDTLGGVERRAVLTFAGGANFNLETEGAVRGYGQMPTYQQLAVPGQALMTSTLQRLTSIAAIRVVRSEVPTEPVETPDSTGGDLGMVLFTHRNRATSQFAELLETMNGLFPEIGDVLTVPIGQGQVQVAILDKFSGERIPLASCGTGISQALYLVSSVLMHPPDRIFLIDEPHVFLHAGAERLLARFLRRHGEHSYVIATHSPVFINATDPDEVLLVTRDDTGTTYRPVLPESLRRVHYVEELGISAADLALHEGLIFVEGTSDVRIFEVILDRLGWSTTHRDLALLPLRGGDLDSRMHHVLQAIRDSLGIPVWAILDGDKAQWANGDWIRALPVSEVEGIFVDDVRAVRQVLLDVWESNDPVASEAASLVWTEAAVGDFLKNQSSKPSKALTDLAHGMGTNYRKPVHGPLLAEVVDIKYLQGVRDVVSPWLGAPDVDDRRGDSRSQAPSQTVTDAAT
jgi:hypothetical protein